MNPDEKLQHRATLNLPSGFALENQGLVPVALPDSWGAEGDEQLCLSVDDIAILLRKMCDYVLRTENDGGCRTRLAAFCYTVSPAAMNIESMAQLGRMLGITKQAAQQTVRDCEKYFNLKWHRGRRTDKARRSMAEAYRRRHGGGSA